MLSRRTDIVIKSADKGSGTVVMDRDWYINECLRQLKDTKFYKLLDNDITTDIQNRILKYTERMNRDNVVNEETKRFLIRTALNPDGFAFCLKCTNKVTLDDLLSLATLTLRNSSHSL